MTASHVPARQIKLPAHIVDLAVDELRDAHGGRIGLRPRSFAVLRLLAENAGRVVTKDEIIEAVWSDVCVTEDSLTQCIADIRKAIGDDDRRTLRNVPRKGYVLVPSQRAVHAAGRMSLLPSLAVMPFHVLSETTPEAGLDLGCGVASEIVNELARNKELRLIGRDSSFPLAGRNLVAQQLGEQLGVRYLVEGTVQRIDGTLVVDVQLVDARDGSIAWADRFTAMAEKVPQVQRAIAAKIAGSVHAGMKETEKHAILGTGPRDLDAYDLTLRGLARKHLFNAEAIRAGRADLEEALRRDPNYAPAHAYLAWLNLIDLLLSLTGEWTPSRLGEIIGQFNRSIELDANLSTSHQGLSQALIHTGDTEMAVSVARRGVELGPSDADGFLFLAVALFENGDVEEALVWADKAIDLNPLRPAYYCFFHAMIAWGNERYQTALQEMDETLRKAPSFRGADTYRVISLVGLGRIDEAKTNFTRLMARPGGILVMPPHPPELASRSLAQLQAAGWRPTLAAEREAG